MKRTLRRGLYGEGTNYEECMSGTIEFYSPLFDQSGGRGGGISSRSASYCILECGDCGLGIQERMNTLIPCSAYLNIVEFTIAL